MMKKKHLLGLENFPASDIDKIIEAASESMKIVSKI